MSIRLILLAVLLAGIARAESSFPLIQSAQPLSLDSLIRLGYEFNPQVRQAGLDVKLNKIGRWAAVGRFLPQVDFGLTFSENHFENLTYTNSDGSVSTFPVTFEEVNVVADSAGNLALDTVTVTEYGSEGKSRSSSYHLSADLTVFDGGQNYFLYRIARTQEKINNLSLLDAQKSLGRNIAQQVVRVLTSEKLLDLNKKLRDQRKDAHDLAKARFEVGAVTELDVLQAEIELGTAENNISTSERDLQTQRETLNQLLGIDLRSSFPLEEPGDITPYQFDLDQLIRDAHQNRTDMEIATREVDLARHNISYGRGAYLPTLSLGAQRSRSQQSGTNESWTLDPKNKNTSYFMNINWNLFDGFAREYDIATKKISYSRAKETERDLSLSLERSVRDAYKAMETVYEQLQTTARNRDLAERTLNLERERYRLGATSALSLRDVQVTYAQAETDNLSKQLEYQSALIALELAVGKTLR